MHGVRRSDSVVHAPCVARLGKPALVGALIALMASSSQCLALSAAGERPARRELSEIPHGTEAQKVPGALPETDAAAPPAGGARHRFGYGFVVAYDQARDDLLIPLRWSGPSVGLRLEWERAASMRTHSLRAVLPASFYENRFGHEGYALGIEIAYSYLRVAEDDFHHGRLSLGGQVKWDVHHGYYESWDEEHIYWLGAYSLGPRLAWSGPRGEGTRLGAELDASLIALVSRPPLERLHKTDPRTKPSFYFSAPHRDLALAGPIDYTAVHAGVSLTRRWGGSSIVFAYDLELVTYDEPERVFTLSNRLSIVRIAW